MDLGVTAAVRSDQFLNTHQLQSQQVMLMDWPWGIRKRGGRDHAEFPFPEIN